MLQRSPGKVTRPSDGGAPGNHPTCEGCARWHGGVAREGLVPEGTRGTTIGSGGTGCGSEGIGSDGRDLDGSGFGGEDSGIQGVDRQSGTNWGDGTSSSTQASIVAGGDCAAEGYKSIPFGRLGTKSTDGGEGKVRGAHAAEGRQSHESCGSHRGTPRNQNGRAAQTEGAGGHLRGGFGAQEDLKQKHAQRAEERKKFQTEVLQLFDARIGEASAKTCGQVGVPSQATSSPADTQLQEAMKKLAEMEKEVARMKQEAHAAATSAPTQAPQHYAMSRAEAEGDDSEEISDVDLLEEVDSSMLPDAPDPVQDELPMLSHAWLLGEALRLHPVDVPVTYAHYGIPLQGLQTLLGTAIWGKYYNKKQLDVSQIVVPRTIGGLLHVALDRIRERLEVGSTEAKAKAKETVLEAKKEAAANRKEKRAARKRDKEPGANGVQKSGLKA